LNENGAGDYITFYSREPEFDLIEPRGISRSVVDVDVGVAGQKLFHPFGFVGGEIVQDAVNFPLSKLMGSQIC